MTVLNDTNPSFVLVQNQDGKRDLVRRNEVTPVQTTVEPQTPVMPSVEPVQPKPEASSPGVTGEQRRAQLKGKIDEIRKRRLGDRTDVSETETTPTAPTGFEPGTIMVNPVGQRLVIVGQDQDNANRLIVRREEGGSEYRISKKDVKPAGETATIPQEPEQKKPPQKQTLDDILVNNNTDDPGIMQQVFDSVQQRKPESNAAFHGEAAEAFQQLTGVPKSQAKTLWTELIKRAAKNGTIPEGLELGQASVNYSNRDRITGISYQGMDDFQSTSIKRKQMPRIEPVSDETILPETVPEEQKRGLRRHRAKVAPKNHLPQAVYSPAKTERTLPIENARTS